MRFTLKKFNEKIVHHGYELVKGHGYFYFYPLDNSKPCLYDSMVMTCRLNDFGVDRWEAELLDKISKTN